jgi:hypothetical protein
MTGQAQSRFEKGLARLGSVAAGVLPGGEEAVNRAAGRGVVDEVLGQDGLDLARQEVRAQGGRQDEGDAQQAAGLLLEEVEDEQAPQWIGCAFQD